MQNLRDQLLKARLITEDQRAKAEARSGRDGRSGRATRANRPKKESRGSPGEGSPGEAPAAEPEGRSMSMPKLSKKALKAQPVNRMLDLSDPGLLRIFQAIEQHRLREDSKGEIPFHFTLRDGRVRKMLVRQEIVDGLESGRLAIVESGQQDRHVIVTAEAAPAIREVDPEAVRFLNG